MTDADELGFVAALVHVEIWLGAHDPRRAFRYLWVTDELFAFHAFGPDEPDTRGGCAVLGTDRLFHDRACTGSLRFAYVCEVE